MNCTCICITLALATSKRNMPKKIHSNTYVYTYGPMGSNLVLSVTGGCGDRTGDLPISGFALYAPEPNVCIQ